MTNVTLWEKVCGYSSSLFSLASSLLHKESEQQSATHRSTSKTCEGCGPSSVHYSFRAPPACSSTKTSSWQHPHCPWRRCYRPQRWPPRTTTNTEAHNYSVCFTKFRRRSRPTGPGRDARPTPRLVTDQRRSRPSGRRAKPIVTPRRAQVAAPDWVLPAGAVLAIATALLPLALKDGEEAAEEIFQQDESVRSLDSRKNRRV